MSINQLIIGALSPLNIPVVPDVYTGQEKEYITFNYSTMGDDLADDAPRHERYLVQVHYFCPLKQNSIATRRRIKQRLFAEDFTWPDENPGTEETGSGYSNQAAETAQHYIYECEIALGVDVRGQI